MSKKNMKLVVSSFLVTLVLYFLINHSLNFSYLVIFISFILSLQAIITLNWMLYAWNRPKNLAKIGAPKHILEPKYSFTALLPARHEEKVIGDTIKAICKIDYPEKLKQIIIICRADDKGTIQKAKDALTKYKPKNASIVVFDGFPINKPNGLNKALPHTKGDVVCIFDAEDEPHTQLYKVVNTAMINKNVDVVQVGVQLMNYRSSWFATLSVLEYYFWFKSGLAFFTNMGHVTPLGGNTVFFRKKYLDQVEGWDDQCLTEDADIGIRLVNKGAKIAIVYEASYCTQEETPASVEVFVKQRTRWVQGFIQILKKKEWLKLPSLRQRIFAFYILSSTLIQSLLFLLAPLLILIGIAKASPLILSIASFLPFYLMFIQIATLIVGLYTFTKDYNLKFYPWMPLKIIVTYFPYQFLITFSALRAIARERRKENSWEKTQHLNLHRS